MLIIFSYSFLLIAASLLAALLGVKFLTSRPQLALCWSVIDASSLFNVIVVTFFKPFFLCFSRCNVNIFFLS